jgi:hypothetical protein
MVGQIFSFWQLAVYLESSREGGIFPGNKQDS